MKPKKIYEVDDVVIVVEFSIKQSDEKLIIALPDVLYKLSKGLIDSSEIFIEFYKIHVVQERKYPSGKIGYRGVFIDDDGTDINYSCYNHFPTHSCSGVVHDDYVWLVSEDFYVFTDVKYVTKIFLNTKSIPKEIYERLLFSLNEWNKV